MKRIKLKLSIGVFMFMIVGLISRAEAIEFPKPVNYVSDFANVLSTTTEDQINKQLQTLETETSTQIFVVSVSDFQETYMEDYAVKLFEEWGIGQADKDNGVLLLFMPEGESGSRVRIEVGYGLEGSLTDAMAGRILDNDFIPSYENKDYNTAVINTVNSIELAVKDEYTVTGNSSTALVFLGIFFLVSFAWVISFGSEKFWWISGFVPMTLAIIIGITSSSIESAICLFAFGIMSLVFALTARETKRAAIKNPNWSSGRSSFSSGSRSSSSSGGGGGRSGGGGASR